jgi:hypothetical protein
VIDPEAMQQHQRPAGAGGVNSNVPSVQAAHAQPRFLIGLPPMLYKAAAAIQPNPCITLPR